MRVKRAFCLCVFVTFILAVASPALAGVLNVPLKTQIYDQWCWAGVSQAIFEYYGTYLTQPQIAAYGTSGYNTWNYLYGSDSESPYYRKGINMIFNHWGLSCTYGGYVMSQTAVQNRIDSGRPFVIRWGWYSGGGHFVAGRGYSGSYVYYMDPWPGEGYQVQLYSWVVDDGVHQWTHSLELTSYPTPPASDHLVLAGGDYNGDDYADIAVYRPGAGLWSVRGITRVYFGSSSDIPVPGDYNGNGRTNIGIFRPSTGMWAIRDYPTAGYVGRAYFGSSSDTPVPGDYNGNGTTQIGIFRPSSGMWARDGMARAYFGGSSDLPVPGDYNGDGTDEIAIFRESSGLWAGPTAGRVYFGTTGDIPVPGDYNGYTPPAKPDWGAAIFRPSTGMWSVYGYTRWYFGSSSDRPVPADYNQYYGDDVAIFRAGTGLWSIRNFTRAYYGASGDIPVTR